MIIFGIAAYVFIYALHFPHQTSKRAVHKAPGFKQGAKKNQACHVLSDENKSTDFVFKSTSLLAQKYLIFTK